MRIGPDARTCAAKAPNEMCIENVIPQPLFVLQFDRVLAPSSVARANYTLTSGTSKDVAFKQIRVDPVERTVVFNVDPPLQPSTAYTLTIKAADRAADRLAAFDGSPFQGTFVVRFTTRASSTVTETDIDPVSGDACKALSVLVGTCTGSNCHGSMTDATAPPAMGLSFVSNEAIQATAVGKGATEVQIAASPKIGSANAPFPYGLQIIAPRDSSSSYLLYKILLERDRGTKTPIAPAAPSLAVGDPNVDRSSDVAIDLAHSVPGRPMPPTDLVADPEGPSPSAYQPLALESVRLLRAWIDRGAPPCNPGAPMGDAGTDAMAEAGGDATTDASTEAATDAADGG